MADPARSAAGVVWLRPGRGRNDDVIEAGGRDRYDHNLGIDYDIIPAVNNEAAAFALAPGQVAEVVETRAGFYVIKRITGVDG